MNNNFNEVYYVIEKSIDYAFDGKFLINFYEYLKSKESTRTQVEEFLDSVVVKNISEIVSNLEEYIVGGKEENAKQLREAYGHIPKPQARKIKLYLEEIIDDSRRYLNEKRTRRKRKKIQTK